MIVVLAILLGASALINVILLATTVHALRGWAAAINDWSTTLDAWDTADAELVELLDQANQPTNVEGAQP